MDNLLQRSKNKPHPFSTSIGDLIKNSTDCSINKEDLGLFLSISDKMNASEEVCKDGLKAIYLRLSSSIGRSQETLWLTLILIELLVKNGRNHLHLTILNKDFLNDIKRILLPKYCAPISHQNKVLQLFDDWIKTLAGVPGYKDLYKIYKSLKEKRIYELANESIESNESINGAMGGTLPNFNMRSVDETQSYLRQSTMMRKKSFPNSQSIQEVHSRDGNCVYCKSIRSAKQKLLSEMEMSTENQGILLEMVTELHPASLDENEAKLLGDVFRTCQQVKSRLTDLATKSDLWEDMINKILELIDFHNQTFEKFDNFIDRVNRENPVLAEMIMFDNSSTSSNQQSLLF